MDNNIIDTEEKRKGNPIASMRFRWQTYTKDTDEPMESVLDADNEQSEANAAFICKAVNSHDSLLEHLKAVTYEYEVALKLLAEAGSFEFDPNQNNLIINSKAAIQKAQQ